MLKIRLQRRGKKNYATYRVVVAQASAPIKGRFIADVGSYNPHTDAFAVDETETKRWLSQGAQASPTVHNLLITHKIITGEKMTIWRPPVKAEASPEEPKETPVEAAPAEEKKGE